MRRAISPAALAGAALATVLTGGVLLLPLGLAFFWTVLQRREEIMKGELRDAKKY